MSDHPTTAEDLEAAECERALVVQEGDEVRVEGRDGWWRVWSTLSDEGRVMIEDAPGASIGPFRVLERRPAPTPAPRSERERMTLRSQSPQLDGVFVPAIDFPGTVVRPGQLHERSFAFARECRVKAIRFPKGFSCERIVLRVGPRFRPIKEDGQEVGRYEGEDARVYEGAEEVRRGEWKNHRLVPELGGFLYVLVRNTTEDDLKFEGTILLQEDRVPTPEHEEL